MGCQEIDEERNEERNRPNKDELHELSDREQQFKNIKMYSKTNSEVKNKNMLKLITPTIYLCGVDKGEVQ